MTINLEERKNIDFSLIQKATSEQARSFTKLLHITRLPRKTLALRLKEMCTDNILIKEDGKYRLNEASASARAFDDNGVKIGSRLSNMFEDRRFRTGLMLIVLLIASSTSGYALARFLAPTEIPQGPTIIGKLEMTLAVSDVEDLYAWQAFITFNSSDMEIIKTISGKFVGEEYPFFLNATDIGEGKLLLGGTLHGTVPGKSTYTPKILATIVFGYYAADYKEPKLSLNQEGFCKTFLLDSTASFMPLKADTLELTTIQP